MKPETEPKIEIGASDPKRNSADLTRFAPMYGHFLRYERIWKQTFVK